jgi:hypothetical protein
MAASAEPAFAFSARQGRMDFRSLARLPLDAICASHNAGALQPLLNAGPPGADRLAACEVELGPSRSPGLGDFLALAVDGLRGALEGAGRRLEVVRAASARGGDAHAAVLDWCAAAGAAELHTIMSRDPFVVEQDNTLRSAAAERGVAVVLHDACYLVHPHRLNLASSSMESRGAGGGGGEEEPWAWAASPRTRAPSHAGDAGQQADCRSSSFLPPYSMTSFGRSRALSILRARSIAGNELF